ncbi:MAG: hypothetical protein QOK72_11965 [Nitrososphaeraceae archaeon]|nr:hypothetical protein [Nitrososphaeraceae archaeon]
MDPSLIIDYINKIDAYLLLGDEKKAIETLRGRKYRHHRFKISKL